MNHKTNNSALLNFVTWLQVVACLVTLTATQSVVADIQITDSHGKYHFAAPPKRVVALNWTLAEQMLELDETPLGMADIRGFRKHSTKPIVPETVVDVGERLSPNLTAIRTLKPDIILIGYSQRSLLRPLSNIATVIYFKNFGNRYNNAEKSRERFLEMAKLFDKTDTANNKLKAADARIEAMRLELVEAFSNGTLPTLQITIPQTDVETKKGKSVWVFGKNSLPFSAAKQLGLEVISPDETSQFGTAQVGIDDLKALSPNKDNALCNVYLSSYQAVNSSDDMTKPDLTGCSFELSYQNAFGGAMSVLYLAEAIYDALISTQR